MLRNHMLPK